MTIVGVHLTKIAAEKKPAANISKVGINNNISIADIAEKDFSLGQAKQLGLRFVFSFICEYSPDLGSITLGGEVLFLENEEKVKQILKEWKDGKKVAGDVMQAVLNAALHLCNIEALKLSQDISLPSPIPLPKVERKSAKPASTAK